MLHKTDYIYLSILSCDQLSMQYLLESTAHTTDAFQATADCCNAIDAAQGSGNIGLGAPLDRTFYEELIVGIVQVAFLAKSKRAGRTLTAAFGSSSTFWI